MPPKLRRKSASKFQLSADVSRFWCFQKACIFSSSARFPLPNTLQFSKKSYPPPYPPCPNTLPVPSTSLQRKIKTKTKKQYKQTNNKTKHIHNATKKQTKKQQQIHKNTTKIIFLCIQAYKFLGSCVSSLTK